MENKEALTQRTRQEGRIAIPFLLWLAGVPLGIVLLLWFFIFRG